MESYQRQNPAQLGLLPLTAYTKLLRVCRIAYENQQRPCMDAWARCYAPWTAHKSRLCQKSHNRHMQFVQTLSSVVHAGKGRKPRLRRVRPTSNNSAILLLLKLLLCRRKHQLNTVQLVYFRSTRIIIDSHDIGIRMIMSDSLYNSLTHNMVR